MTIEHYELSYDGMTTLCTRCHKNPVSEELEGYIVGYLHNIHETIEDAIPVYGREIYGLCDSCRVELKAFMKMKDK